MTDEALNQFRANLTQRNQVGVLQHEVLRHEMNATINRHRLTGQQEGITSFNTSQLCWLVSTNPTWTREHFLFVGFLLSLLIDDEIELFKDAQEKQLLPEKWTWVSWANNFQGNEDELLNKLATISDPREQSGAICLATRSAPQAIGSRILTQYCNISFAKVYHRLLSLALRQPNAHEVANKELERLATELEVLFAGDTDLTLSALVQASTLENPEIALKPFKDAAGELTLTAVARRHLEQGRAKEALELIKDLRFLSPAYDQAILVAALAALECKQFEKAEFYSRNIDDNQVRLKICTRIAQATGDIAAELDALSQLYELPQENAQVFVQLINVLIRLERADLIVAMCIDAQERFQGDPLIDSITKRYLVKS